MRNLSIALALTFHSLLAHGVDSVPQMVQTYDVAVKCLAAKDLPQPVRQYSSMIALAVVGTVQAVKATGHQLTPDHQTMIVRLCAPTSTQP